MGFEVRAEIAAALSTVPDVRGYERKPRATKIGDAWPKWSGDAHVAPGAYETSWTIVVLMPNDEAAQEKWIEEHRDALIEALAVVVWTDSMQPGLSDDSPALMLTCRE